MNQLLEEDPKVIEISSSEWSYNCLIARYLENRFDSFDVDVEYNKHGEEYKWHPSPDESGKIRPDIIVHERGTDDRNLLVIEIKKDATEGEIKNQKERVNAFVSGEDYQYDYGLFLDLNSGKNPDYYWFLEQ